MPNFKTHISSGVITFPVFYLLFLYLGKVITGYYFHFNAIQITLGFSLFILGSDFPDVDHQNALINKVFRILLLIFSVYYAFDNKMFFLKYIKLPFLFESTLILILSIVFGIVIGYIFNKTTKHRGIWHSIFMAIFWSILIYFLNYRSFAKVYYSISFLFGDILHLFLDKFFQEGKNGLKLK
ncbi:hypothetical protein OSSY52_09780 [Tepiditoga spiralis]|uniref:Metal-dependent hydrolase n=1 Tax=Tepiditoga spiralis TaxID=2108365 RepID=A0A7G1G7D3_9BACT|nr:metal-dependent hydrolase [Tepiditoga spiralis]BBE30837.1 hypothetical protein OSSY52_09780 [Tepiditoga spiralis]